MSEVLAKLSREEMIINEFSQAFTNDEFYLVFQPKMDTLTKKFTGVEVLLRWYNQLLGNVSPDEFIRIAEDHGYIQDVGEFVLHESLKIAGKWLVGEYNFESIAINISPIELGKETFVQDIVNLCHIYNVPHSMVQLEITEHIHIGTVVGATNVLCELKQHGFSLAIDDFGVENAYELLLIDVAMDTIKIDKSLIGDIQSNKQTVSAIINLAKKKGYNIVAEGVETSEQLDILTELNCCQIQGYYYSKPLEETKIITLFN